MGVTILGLDPGFASLGWAIVKLDGSTETLVDMGVFRTEKSAKKSNTLAADDNFRRAKELAALVDDLARQHSNEIDAVAAEAMSFPRSSSAAAKMAMCWGVVAAWCEFGNIPLVQASPQAIKKALCGTKAASKDDVRLAICKRFPDAIGIAGGTISSLHEHCFDAAGAIVACLQSEVVLALRKRG